MGAVQSELFEAGRVLPAGMACEPDFIGGDEEAALLETIAALPLKEARYKDYTTKRRVLSYGSSYDFDTNERISAPPLPKFLFPLRDRVCRWLKLPVADFAHALISEYRPGTALGWHRDVPEFEIIVGVSLGTACRMRFRPYPPAGGRQSAAVTRQPSVATPFDLDLAPRSAYVMRGPARWDWQHSIPPAKGLRYSITLRTLAARH
jgi:alkylated DNA repair dioxygenase AlkB